MTVIIGKVLNAEGPVAPVKPQAEIDTLKAQQAEIDNALPGMYAMSQQGDPTIGVTSFSYLVGSKYGVFNADRLSTAIGKIGPLSNRYQEQWKALEAKYAADYSKYLSDLQAYEQATMTPEEQQIASAERIEAQKIAGQLQVAQKNADTKKIIIIIVAVVVLFVGGFFIYKKVKK